MRSVPYLNIMHIQFQENTVEIENLYKNVQNRNRVYFTNEIRTLENKTLAFISRNCIKANLLQKLVCKVQFPMSIRSGEPAYSPCSP